MLTITIFDDDGYIVSEDVTDADLASESEVSEMIQMMNAGMPAWLAALTVQPTNKS